MAKFTGGCNGQYKAAIESAEEALRHAPGNFGARVALASAYGYLGRTRDAQKIVEGFDETARSFVEGEPRWADATKNYVIDGLRKAGLPE
ncbi:MAG: tetratricopeptide repeat protein [Woeseiaceae bacterium]|nr:tetratricopeptide repeat protein [Woeseiaceae bacterium]